MAETAAVVASPGQHVDEVVEDANDEGSTAEGLAHSSPMEQNHPQDTTGPHST